MKKFIFSSDRTKLVEASNIIDLVRDYELKNGYYVSVNSEIVSEVLTYNDAQNQITLIAAFLNSKNTINEAVYFMPVLKQKTKKYRLTVYSNYEEDEAEPYTVDYDTMPDALNAKEQYENELTLSGQHAYSVVGPDVIEE